MKRARVGTPHTPAGHVVRHGARIFDSKRHDPYQLKGKHAGPLRCGQCGAIYRNGRWQWSGVPDTAALEACPACQRARDRMPAGWLTLEGPLVAARGDELVRTALNEATHERSEHPLHRVMATVREGDRVEISTTDVHLPQRIGRAIKRAHHGTLAIRYGSDEYSVRVHWRG